MLIVLKNHKVLDMADPRDLEVAYDTDIRDVYSYVATARDSAPKALLIQDFYSERLKRGGGKDERTA
jgi:hypothetical protein